MTDIVPTSTTTSQKRVHEGGEFPMASDVSDRKSDETHLPTPTSPAASDASAEPIRQPSMAGTESSALSSARTPSSCGGFHFAQAPANDRPSKKRKLTFVEKEVERAVKASEQEAARRKRAEEAYAREQEKMARDEERRQKAEEKEHAKKQREVERAEREKVKDAERQAKDEHRRRKEEEKKMKEAEKQAKEEAKRKKEEEKNKQEKSQLRLASFFGKPRGGEEMGRSPRSSSRRSSVGSVSGLDNGEDHTQSKSSTPKKTQAKDAFLPFYVLQHVQMAPFNRFIKDQSVQNAATTRLDGWLQEGSVTDQKDLLSSLADRKRKRGQKPQCTMREIVNKHHGTFETSTVPTDQTVRVAQLSDIPYKFLSFMEDVRPPYKGTYTRAVPSRSVLKLSRCPFTRELPDTDYDYDSEAEWEPPHEGDEDLESGDDDSDAGDEGDEDMDGFLDDEDDTGKRRHVLGGGGDMTPISSGLCWANAADERGPLEEYRIRPLSDHYTFPIDPFSTVYWPKAAMQPPAPRLPLSSLNPRRNPSSLAEPGSSRLELINGHGYGGKDSSSALGQSSICPDGKQQAASNAAQSSTKPLRSIPDDVLPAFKTAVEGSELTKAGLIEVLKKQFPRLSKDAIKHTLGQVAVRQGVREADKKWVLATSVETVGGRHWTWKPGLAGVGDEDLAGGGGGGGGDRADAGGDGLNS